MDSGYISTPLKRSSPAPLFFPARVVHVYPPCDLQRRRGRKRVTLLVNVWLKHKPSGIARLPASIAQNLSGGVGYPFPCFEQRVSFFPVPVERVPLGCGKASARVAEAREQSEETIEFKGPLGPTTDLKLRLPTPERLSMSDWKALHSFELSYGEGRCPNISSCSNACPDLGP